MQALLALPLRGAGSKATATVHFAGEIVASTCVVSSANLQNTTVTLPKVTNQFLAMMALLPVILRLRCSLPAVVRQQE